jgi:ribosomal protein L16 Arg81 hydroxylase
MAVWPYRSGASWPFGEVDVGVADYLRYVETGDPAGLETAGAPVAAGAAWWYGPVLVDRCAALLEPCRAIAADLGLTPPATAGAVSTRLYVSRMGATSGLHWDGRATTLVQLHGTKEAVLFAPSMGPRLDPFPGPQGPNSAVDPFAPAHARLRPRLRVELAPGDVLEIPHGWWHCLRATSPTCTSYSCW